MKRPFLSLALVIAAPIAALAQPIAPLIDAPIAAPAPKPGGGQVIINSPAGNSTFNNKTGVGVMTKDVTVTQTGEDFILYAQRVSFSRPKNQATASEDLRVETRDSTIRAVRMFGDFNTKVLSLTGDVVISSYGEGDGVQTEGADARRAKEERKPLRISCDRLDWNYDTRQATLVGNLRIVQGDYVGTCNKIIYDEPKNAARLIGDVRFGNSKQQEFLSDELVLFIDKDLVQSPANIRVVGPVNTAGDGAAKPTPKTATAFPEPGTLADDADIPAPPKDIDKFLNDEAATKPKKPTKVKPAAPTVPPEKTAPVEK